MRTYSAVVTKDGRWWLVTVPELHGYVRDDGAVNIGTTTQARRLSEVKAQARDLICTVTGENPSEITVVVTEPDSR